MTNGKRTPQFFRSYSNAVHFPPTDEERAWRHRHRVHTDRFADRRRGDHRIQERRHQGFGRDEQRRQYHDLIESVLVGEWEWAVRQRAAHFFCPAGPKRAVAGWFFLPRG